MMLVLLIPSISIAQQSDFIKESYDNFIKAPENKKLDKDKQLSKFIESFDYEKYTKAVKIDDFKTLQADRYYLWSKMGDGDVLILKYIDYYLGNHKISLTNMSELLALSESYLMPKGFNPQIDWIYNVIGYYMLNKVATLLEYEIEKGNFDVNDKDNKKIISKLNDYNLYLEYKTPPKDTLSKDDLSEDENKSPFEFGFIKSKKIRILIIVILGFVAIILISLLIILKGVGKRPKIIIGIILLSILLDIGFLCLPFIFTGENGLPTKLTTLELKNENGFYPYTVNGRQVHSIKTYEVIGNDSKIGSSVWMTRPYSKALFFASDSFNNYEKFKSSNRKILIETALSNTNKDKNYYNFTLEHGLILSSYLRMDKDAMVIVEDTGGIRVINIKDKYIIPQNNTTLESPFRTVESYFRLFSFCMSKNIVAFQSELLMFSDNICDISDEDVTNKFIILARDNKTKVLYHIVFNFLKEYPTNFLIKEIKSYMDKNHDFKIEVAVNLKSKGLNTVFNVYNDHGELIKELSNNNNDITNELKPIIVYYYED